MRQAANTASISPVTSIATVPRDGESYAVWRNLIMKLPFTLGRLLFGGFYLYNGITHFLRYKSYAEYAAAKKVPLPEIAVWRRFCFWIVSY
jgi:hypothetical protein